MFLACAFSLEYLYLCVRSPVLCCLSSGKSCPYPDDNIVIECSAGYYSLAGAQNCTVCPLGYACPVTTLAPQKCSSGYALGGATTCLPCPAGFACAADFTAIAACPTGSYSLQGSTVCTPCPGQLFSTCSDDSQHASALVLLSRPTARQLRSLLLVFCCLFCVVRILFLNFV